MEQDLSCLVCPNCGWLGAGYETNAIQQGLGATLVCPRCGSHVFPPEASEYLVREGIKLPKPSEKRSFRG